MKIAKRETTKPTGKRIKYSITDLAAAEFESICKGLQLRADEHGDTVASVLLRNFKDIEIDRLNIGDTIYSWDEVSQQIRAAEVIREEMCPDGEYSYSMAQRNKKGELGRVCGGFRASSIGRDEFTSIADLKQAIPEARDGRTLENCSTIAEYGKPEQSGGKCFGVFDDFTGKPFETCKDCEYFNNNK